MGQAKSKRGIGPFRLDREINSTPVSKTYLASSPDFKSRVILKIMRAGSAPGLSEEGLSLIAHEAEISKMLDHGNIVPILQAGVTDRCLFVAMTPVQGFTINAVLKKKGRFSSQTGAEIALETAKALAFGHGRGLYHKNLKSTNVFLKPGGKVAVADFGLGRIPDPLEKAGHGTDYSHRPEFLAPEQAAGDYDRVDQRSDVYALGILLYWMLTGSSPYEVGRGSHILYQILNTEPVHVRKRDRSVPKALEAICLKAIQKKPHERYWSMAEMATDLKRFLSGEPVRAIEDSFFRRLLGKITTSKAGMSLAFVFALLTAVGSGILLRNLTPTKPSDPAKASPEDGESRGEHRPGSRTINKPGKAKALLKKALDIPLTRKKLPRRIALLKEATETDCCYHEAHLHLGYNLLLFGKVSEAQGCLSRGCLGEPNAFSKYLWGLVYHEYMMDTAAARKEFEEGTRAPEYAHYAPLCRAWNHWLSKGASKEALSALQDGADENAYPWETGLLRGIIAQSPPDPTYSTARFEFSRATEALGGYAPALVRRALAFMLDTSGRFRDRDICLRLAIRDLNVALAIEPYVAHARTVRGRLRMGQGKFETALVDLDLAVNIAPRYWDGWFLLGDCLIQLKNYERAFRILTKAIELRPNSAPTFIRRAVAAYHLKRFSEAESDYRKAVDIAPFSAGNRWLLGKYLDSLGRTNEALAEFDQAVRMAPKGATYYWERAVLKTRLGRKIEAREDYEQCTVLDATMVQAHYEAAKILALDEGNLLLAEDYLVIGLKNCPPGDLRKQMEDFLNWVRSQLGR